MPAASTSTPEPCLSGPSRADTTCDIAVAAEASSGPGQPLAPSRQARLVPQSLSHVVLRTTANGLTSMRAWYLSLLDADVTFENHQICFIGYDEEHHRIGLLATAPTVDDTSTVRALSAVAHIAFVLASLSDLAAFYTTRKALGIEPSSCINHGPTMSMYYDDPDGNGIEIMVYNLADRHAVDAYLATPEFQQNPVGADFDPDDFVRRIESGEDEELIKKRPHVGPRAVPA